MKDQDVHSNCPQPNLIEAPQHHEQNHQKELINNAIAHESTKSLNSFYCTENMNIKTDNICANVQSRRYEVYIFTNPSARAGYNIRSIF